MMKNLLTISILLLPFSTNISFANETTGDIQSQDNQEQTSSSESRDVLNALNNTTSGSGFTVQEGKFLEAAEKLSRTSEKPANDLIDFMKDNHLTSSTAKKLKNELERLKYKISEKPGGGGLRISYTKDGSIQADDSINTKYKKAIDKTRNIDANNCNMYPCNHTNMPNDDISLRIQNLDKTIRLVSNDIGLLNDSIISTKIKLDGIVHNLNNIIGYIQMTDGYKWQSFLQNMQVEKNNQPPKEYIISMDNLSKTINDMSIVLKQVLEQKATVQPQIIQQPCQQVHQSQYADNLNKTVSELSIMLQQALKRDDSQSNQKCQSCLINERINKVNDDKASREYVESIESLNKTLLSMSEKLNDVINHKHTDSHHEHSSNIHDNARLEQEQTSTLANLNKSLHNISNELQKVANKMDAINDKDVNITVIGQNASNPFGDSSTDDVAILSDRGSICGGPGSLPPRLIENNDTGNNVNPVDVHIAEKAEKKPESTEDLQDGLTKNTGENHDAKPADTHIAEKAEEKPENTDENQDSKTDEVQIDISKQEIHPVNDVKNLGIVKQQISEFESIIDSNKGPKAGNNGIINSNSDTSRYNEIKTESEQNVKSEVEDKNSTLPVLPPAPPVLSKAAKEDVSELDKEAEKNLSVLNDQDNYGIDKVEPKTLPSEPTLNAQHEESIALPPAPPTAPALINTPPPPPALPEVAKEDSTILDKEAEKEAAYNRFLEKRRLEREQELRKISGIDDLPPPPPAPTLDLSKVPGAPTPLKINKKHSVPKKLGIVAEMAKRFNELNNSGTKTGYNGLVKEDSNTSGYNEIKHQLKQKNEHK